MEVENPELYQYDGEVVAKAEEMGKPGLVDIKQRTVGCCGGPGLGACAVGMRCGSRGRALARAQAVAVACHRPGPHCRTRSGQTGPPPPHAERLPV